MQHSGASVLPVYFEGQNSWIFHLVSRISLTLRLSLLVSEFRKFVGSNVRLHVGEVVRFAALEHKGDRRRLTDELYARVHQLSPDNRGKPLAALQPRSAAERVRFPWDPPGEAPPRASDGARSRHANEAKPSFKITTKQSLSRQLGSDTTTVEKGHDR